jgi:hypothetical protein
VAGADLGDQGAAMEPGRCAQEQGLAKKVASDLRKWRSTRAVRFRDRTISLFDLVKVPKTASDLRASGHAQQTLNLTARSARPFSQQRPDSPHQGRNRHSPRHRGHFTTGCLLSRHPRPDRRVVSSRPQIDPRAVGS